MIPKELNLENYIDKDLLNNNKRKSKYLLYAINKKLGMSSEIGHYYCSIKIDENWYEFWDRNVNSIIFDEKKPSTSVVGLFYVQNK